jgi:hypothetical protein
LTFNAIGLYSGGVGWLTGWRSGVADERDRGEKICCMNIRFFVSLSGLLLALWLGVTFQVAVPAKHYPQLGKKLGGESVQVLEKAGSVEASGELMAGTSR